MDAGNNKGAESVGLVTFFIAILLVCIVGIAVVLPVATEIINSETQNSYPTFTTTHQILTFHINNTQTLSGNLSYITLNESGTANFTGEYANVTIYNNSSELFGWSATKLTGNQINITGNDTINGNSLYTVYAQFYWNNSTAGNTMDFIVDNITQTTPSDAAANLTITEGYDYDPAGSVTIENCVNIDSRYAQYNSTHCIDAASITGTSETVIILIPLMIVVAVFAFIVGGIAIRG